MFSGIVQTIAKVDRIEHCGENIDFTLRSAIAGELHVDQSVSHNGVCLTVTSINGDCYTVTAIAETLQKTNLGLLEVGSEVNLERSMKVDGMLDGHIVQGHVDTTATCCMAKQVEEGSWRFAFRYEALKEEFVTVEKGSVAVNGVSLTVVNSAPGYFEVAIIPYTFENTNFHNIKEGTVVNIEFDILGKYILKYISLFKK